MFSLLWLRNTQDRVIFNIRVIIRMCVYNNIISYGDFLILAVYIYNPFVETRPVVFAAAVFFCLFFYHVYYCVSIIIIPRANRKSSCHCVSIYVNIRRISAHIRDKNIIDQRVSMYLIILTYTPGRANVR